MATDDAKRSVNIQRVDVGQAVSAKWTVKPIFHAAILLHCLVHFGSHEQLDGKYLGLLAKASRGWMEFKLSRPGGQVDAVVVWLNLSARDPDRLAIRLLRIGQSVTVGRHDALDRSNNVLVGRVGVSRQRWLNRKRRDDTAGR